MRRLAHKAEQEEARVSWFLLSMLMAVLESHLSYNTQPHAVVLGRHPEGVLCGDLFLLVTGVLDESSNSQSLFFFGQPLRSRRPVRNNECRDKC